MKPWWQVIQPHADIREGRFDESVFAADLSDVIAERGPLDYRDAHRFFRRTYPSQGLRTLMAVVLERLAGKKGDPVIQIETPFGGGKTHSLIALYHLAKAGQSLDSEEWVSKVLEEAGVESFPAGVRVVSFVGTAADAQKGLSPWGEMGKQLGCYELVREHDEKRRAPGKELLHRVIGSEQPTLILMDEVAEYAVKAQDFFEQVIAFFHELTETVKVLPKCALVVTLPSSVPYGEKGERALHDLQRVFGRVQAIYTPVEGEEIYEVIRCRLFDEVVQPRVAKRIAEDFFNLYERHKEDLPYEVREPFYRERLAKAYPFHPEVIDILLEKWGSYSTFQRTRGMLRFLAYVVGDLYERRDSCPLVLPSRINLENPSIRRELLTHIGNEYESVIRSDVAGLTAKAVQLDSKLGSEYQKFEVAKGLATAIFFGSFSGGERQGVSVQRLRLALLQEGLPPAFINDTLSRLEESLWYLHVDGGSYRFAAQPNLNRVILEREETIKEEVVEGGLRELMGKEAGRELKVFVFPDSPQDIPDTRELKLAILGPHHVKGTPATEFAKKLLEQAGTSFRVYRNALFILAAEHDDLEKLRNFLKKHLALKAIINDEGLTRQLKEDDVRKLRARLKDMESQLRDTLHQAYRHLAQADECGTVWDDLGLPTFGDRSSLAQRVKQFLKQRDRLLEKIAPSVLLRHTFGEQDEEKRLADVRAAFYQFPRLPAVENDEVVWKAVAQGVREGIFAVRCGDQVYCGVTLPADVWDDEEAVLVRTPPSGHAPLATGRGEAVAAETPPSTTAPAPNGLSSGAMNAPVLTGNTRLKLRAKVQWDKLTDFLRGVILPLQKDGAEIHMEVSLEATTRAGDVIKQETVDHKVRETLTQIGAEIIQLETE